MHLLLPFKDKSNGDTVHRYAPYVALLVLCAAQVACQKKYPNVLTYVPNTDFYSAILWTLCSATHHCSEDGVAAEVDVAVAEASQSAATATSTSAATPSSLQW